MKVLITGGAGFIGAWVTKAFHERGDEVTIIDDFSSRMYPASLKEARVEHLLKGVAVRRGDITEPEVLYEVIQERKPACIVHLAAIAGIRYAQKNPYAVVQHNVEGTLSVFEQAGRAGVARVVYASSASVYGRNEKIPFHENDPVNRPSSLYSATKRESELIAAVYRHTRGIASTGIRFFTAYGPWVRPDMATFLFTKAIIGGETISLYAEGKAGRDYTHVGDIVRGVLAVVDHPEVTCDLVNLGNSSPVTNGELVARLERLIGKKAHIEMKPLPPEDVPMTYADISRAKELYGWEPRMALEDGLKEFVDWYKSYYVI